MKKRIFLICPVRKISKKTIGKIRAYVRKLEKVGVEVHWPFRDTNQNDLVGVRICFDNGRAILCADEVHIWYDKESQGSVFDLGMFFMASVIMGPEKALVIVNPESVTKTEAKSLQNVLLALAEK